MRRPKPFAKYRIEYHPTPNVFTRTPTAQLSPAARLVAEIEGELPGFGIFKSRVVRLDFSQEESLADTANMIDQHYQFVAEELATPFTMGFRG